MQNESHGVGNSTVVSVENDQTMLQSGTSDRQPPTAPAGPNDLSSSPDDAPAQPLLKSYPVTEKLGRKRSFRSDWYKLHPWMEYSQQVDAAFCFACRHFPSFGKEAESAFTSTGFRNWKKANYTDAGFSVHAKGDFHKTAMIMWQEYKQMKYNNTGSVLQLQSDVYAKQVAENRHYIKTVAEVLLLTAIQNLAQRGHRENLATDDNPGNFKKILQLVVQHDKTISDRFNCDSVVTRYTSKDIQNEILSVMADMVREHVIDEVKQSVYFSVLVDETKDVSKKEQLSFVLRFFANGDIHECFVDFKPATGLDAESLSEEILKTLQQYGLDVRSCLVGQGYDGASVMSGANRGVQQRVREHAPLAVYTHCYAHRLNLVLVDCCKSVDNAVNFFALLEKLYVFVSGATAHKLWLETQKQLFPDEAPRQLQRLSDTRWACRITACRNVRDRFEAIVCTLEKLASGPNADRSLEAKSLLLMLDFTFVLMLHLFCDLLGKIHAVSNHLQSASMDLSCAAELVRNLIDGLRVTRNDDDVCVATIFNAAEELCGKCNISPTLTTPRRRKLPQRFAVCIVEQSVGQRAVINSQTDFRQHVYLPVIDCVIAELESRFSQEATSVMSGIQAMTPGSKSFLNTGDLEAFARQYNSNVEDLGHEIHQLRRLLERTEEKSNSSLLGMLDLARFLEPYKLAFAEAYRLLCIGLVLPVTSAACERSFSTLKLIKTYLRSSMCDSRLSNIAVLSVESARARSIDFDAFVDEFDARHHNRKLSLH